MHDVAVLGAGPAGLAAAWWAAREGASVVVLERGPSVGGLAASFDVAGVRVDHGSHRLHPSIEPAIQDELRAVLGADLQVRPRNGRIRLAGRWISFPLRTADLVRHLPPSFAAGAVADLLTARWRTPADDTFAEVIRARLGRTMERRFYAPYARKIWGLDATELSGEQARRRISSSSAVQLLAKVVRGDGPATFFYPRRGFGQIPEALVGAAAGAGADVRCGVGVSAVELAERGVRLVTDAGTVEAAQLWSTIPITALARLATPAPPPAVMSAAGALRFRAMLLVYLAVERGRWTPYDAHYLPEPSTAVTRVSEPKNYRDGDDPDDVTVLCAEIPCEVGDQEWTADDGALGRRVAADLARLGLPSFEPAEVVVRRLPHAYPIYARGWEASFATLDGWAAVQPRLLTFGRQGLFAHDNTHHTLAMARAAVAAMVGGGGTDAAAWAAARRRFATHVVED